MSKPVAEIKEVDCRAGFDKELVFAGGKDAEDFPVGTKFYLHPPAKKRPPPAGRTLTALSEEQERAVAKLLNEALRIPSKPFPDPVAHSLDAYARALHAAYCAIRFKIMDALKEVRNVDPTK